MKENTMSYKIVQKTINGDNNRYIIVDEETNKTIDDAQGYGYKSRQKAHAAYRYKYGGGKENDAKIKKFWKENKELKNYCYKLMENNFKAYALGEVTHKDFQKEIKKEFNVDLPISYLRKIGQ